jgi:hypothetical protein
MGVWIDPDLCREGALQSSFPLAIALISTRLRDTRIIGGLIRRTDVLLASVAEIQHGQAFWLFSLLAY